MENATTFMEVRVGRSSGARRSAAMGNTTAFMEVRVGRNLEAAFLLEDLKERYENVTVLRYSSIDYQLPLLASNARYRCGWSIFDIRAAARDISAR